MVRARPDETPSAPELARLIGEHDRLIGEHEAKLNSINAERASLYQAHASGTLPPEIMPPTAATEALKLANTLLNGSAPPDFLKLYPDRTREAQLSLEKEALHIVLDHLGKERAKLRAIEGIQWQKEARPKFDALYRKALLCRSQLVGLIAEMEKIKASGRRYVAVDLGELSMWVDALLENPATALVAFSRAENIAIAQRLVTRSELNEASKNVSSE